MTAAYRVLITGSRDWDDKQAVWSALAEAVRTVPPDREIAIVHGACPTGADEIAHQWALGYGATPEPHRATWVVNGRRDRGAGPRRNRHMVSLGADICLAFIGPCTGAHCQLPRPHPSHGASGCADLAEATGIPVRRWTP